MYCIFSFLTLPLSAVVWYRDRTHRRSNEKQRAAILPSLSVTAQPELTQRPLLLLLLLVLREPSVETALPPAGVLKFCQTLSE